MIAAAAERGWIDGRRAMTEAVTAIVRAGAGIVITYAAADLATWLRERAMTRRARSTSRRSRSGSIRPGGAGPTRSAHDDGCALRRGRRRGAEPTASASFSYSSIGLEPGVDLLLWRMAPSVDALETSAAALLRAGLGRWLTVATRCRSDRPSQYVRKPTDQEQSLFTGERSPLPRRLPVHQDAPTGTCCRRRRARAS